MEVARDLQLYREIVALKARQLGFTWLVLAYALQQLLFYSVGTVLPFSKREDEAAELLDFRLREMYRLDDLGEQVAELAGKIDPSMLVDNADRLAVWYGNKAGGMVERNNHGAGVIAWWKDNGRARLLNGHDGKPGWLSNRTGKVLLYDACTEAFQHAATELHSLEAWVQLSSIEGNTLKAPEGCHDDRADAYALAVVALSQCKSVPWKVRTF